MATRKYDKTRLDLHYKKSNENLEFYISDTDTSDFYIRLTRANMPIKVDDLIIVLCVIDPSNQVRTQFISADTNKEGFVYCKLENSMKSQVGTYQAKVMLVYEDEKIVTDTFTYTVKNDMFVALSQEIIADERFETLNDMLSEISRIKNQEEDRVVAENGRVATMTRIENEIAQLVLDVNSKVNTNVSENTTKTDELILSVNTKVDNSLNMNKSSVNELITKGDNILSGIELNSNQLITSIDEYKNSVVEDIGVYKTTKDSEINQTLTDYKTSTTESVNSFIEGETLKIRNDLTVDCNAYKESLNTEFNKLDSDLKLNINNFVADKSTYIDTYLQGKSLELTRYINDKNVELNTYVNTKNTELNTYKTTKNAEIDKYFNDKNTEFNTNEKTRSSNESRRETNEYSRGLNENNRKAAEDKRVSSFTQMTTDFNAMIQYNNDTLNNKYDDIVSDGTTITMKANGVIKKSITLSNSGGSGETHTHTNKTTLDKIAEEKLTSWDNKVNSVAGKGLSTNDYTTIEKTKLQGIEQNANNYIHPTIHLPSMIAQDNNNRFVTDIEKLMWNSKSNFSGSYDDLSNKPIIPTVTNDLTSTLKANYDTAYTHSQSNHAPSTAQKNSDITKEEIEAKLTGVINSHSHSSDLVTTSIVGTTLTLTTDKYQSTTMVTGTTIVLPTVTSFTEIHLFFSVSSDMTLTLPSCKWQSTPTITSGKYYELIFTYTDTWLGGCICYS